MNKFYLVCLVRDPAHTRSSFVSARQFQSQGLSALGSHSQIRVLSLHFNSESQASNLKSSSSFDLPVS